MSSNLKDIYVGVKKNDKNRIENDFYPTPPLATYILHKYVSLPKHIVEPCAGRGNISVELMRNGYDVKSYDLYDYPDKLCNVTTGTDVLSLIKPKGYDGLVTNPPYYKDLPRKIALKGIAEYDVTALFVRLTFLEGKKRHMLFEHNTPSDIIFLSDRIKFNGGYPEPIEKIEQLGGMIAYAWIVFDKRTIQTTTRLKWVLLEKEYDEWKKNYREQKETHQINIMV